MVKRLQKSALVTVLIALCLLLGLAMVVAFVPSARVQAEDGATTIKYITADGTLSDTAGEGSIAVDVDADGTLVFNRIEQFNAVENDDVAGVTTYTIKPYGYNYDGGIIVYPAFKKQIAEYIFNQSASISSSYKFTINTLATLKWRVVVPYTVTQIADFSFAYFVEGKSSKPGVTTYNKVYGWNCSGSGTTPVGAAGMVGLEFEKGDTDYDLKLGAGIMGANAVKSLEIPARVTQMASAPTLWTTDQFNDYYTDEIKNDTSDLRYLNEGGTTYARGRLEKVLTGAYSGENSSYASSYVAMDLYHIGTFSDCYAETVKFEENGKLTEIPAYSFVIASKATSGNSFYMSKFTTLTLSGNITKIGEYAFVNNYCLRNVDLKNVETIGTYAFSYCFTYSLNSSKGNLITMGSDKDEEGAASIVLPDTLTTLATKAFYICPGLTSITVGSGLTTIATDSFSGSSSLPTKIAEIHLSDDALKNWLSIDFGTKNCLITSTDTKIYVDDEELTDLVIPEGVTEIKARAFENYTTLESVEAGSELQKIGANAFNGCTQLKSFTFPDKAAEAGSEYAVDGVDSALTTIGANAFNNTGLTLFVIPASVTSIDSNAFANCTSLKELYNLSSETVSGYSGAIKTEYHGDTSLKKVGDFVFQVEEDGKPLQKPKLISYNGHAEAVTLPNGYEGKPYDIEAGVFMNNASIVFLRIPADSVDVIGASAFEGATKLQSIIIDNGIGSIGASAFEGCTELISVVIQGAISSIKDYAFCGCTNLNAFNINDSQLVEIGKYAFYNCSALAEIIMPDSVTTIGQYAFYNCSSLSNLKLSTSITAIPDHTFSHTALGSLVVPDSVKEIGDNAFEYADLTDIYIGSGVTTIGYSAFGNNVDLETIEFAPDSALRTVGRSVFQGSEKVKRLAYPDSVQSIERGRIVGIAPRSGLVELRLPASYVALANSDVYDISGDNNNMSVYLPEVNDGNRANYGANMLGFLVRFGTTNEGATVVKGKLFKGVGCIIAPDKEAYDLMVSAINSFSNSDFSGYDKDEYIAKLFVLGEVTYKLRDKDGNAAGEVVEQKLYSADGAAMAYAPVTADGATHWVQGSSVTFPSDIDGFDASGVTWKYGNQTVTKDFALTVENYGKYEFTAQLTINAILFPFENGVTSKVYDGKAWTMPERYANLLSFTVEGDKDTTNVDEYVLTVSLKNVGDRWSDSTNAPKTVTLTVTPAEYEVVWKMTGDWKGNAKTYNGVSIGTDIGLKLGLNNEIEVTGEDIEIYDENDNKVDNAVNAGEYRVVIKAEALEEYTNYTFVNTEQTLIINKRAIDISNSANLAFGLDGYNADLRDGWLYIYDDIPYISAQSDKGTPTIINVKKSYVRYRQDTQMTIVISNIPNDDYGTGKVYSVAYEGNNGTAVGTYQATATLSSANYSFMTTNKDSSELLARGLVIVINSDGTATVDKTWYIVRMENSLVDAEGNEYEIIAGWTYGDSVDVVAPKLEFGSDEQAKTAIKISLTLNGEYIAGFGVDQFAYYINSSMPAGNYDVIFSVDSIKVIGELGEIMHNGFDNQTFHINVATKTNADMYGSLNEKLQNATFEYKYIANRPQFLGELNAVDLVKFTYETRQGYWNSPAANKYFSDKATITFNVEGMQSSDYREVAGFTAEDDYVPMNVGTYVVYYQVNVDSYTSLVANILSATSNRKSYKFTVIIYDELNIPTVSSAGLVYTGNKVLPDIEDNEQYAIVWSDTDAYIAGGTHSVSFKLYDKVHYRWKGVDGDTVSVNFTIAKANNDFTTALNILGWNFETFDAAVNSIRAAALFLDEGQDIHFRVVKKDETTALDGLADFTVDGNGRVDETVAAVLNALKVGEYTLYAKVNGTGNYNEYERDIPFAVNKAMNSWADGDDDLKLPSWIVGKYDKKENAIVVNAAHGQVNIIIADINGKEYYNSTTGLNKLNDCEVGKYLLKAWVDETEDFAALAERTFTIEVLEKIGLPWWATLLITVGALLVAALIIFILWKKGVFQILTEKIVVAIRTKASVDATIASVRAAKKMEEGKQSVADAKRRERIEQMREKAKAQRALPPEERAAMLEEKAKAEAERAEQLRARSEAKLAKAAKMRGNDAKPAAEEQTTEEPTAEAAATETPETPTEE